MASKADPIGPLMAALEHPLRSRILAILSIRSATAAEIAEQFDEPAAKVRYHLRALAKSGLIGVRAAKKRRGAREQRWIAGTAQIIGAE